MRHRACVCAGMPVRRRIAAQGDAARLARPQVDPRRSGLDAFLAFVRARRLDGVDCRDVGTTRFAHDGLPLLRLEHGDSVNAVARAVVKALDALDDDRSTSVLDDLPGAKFGGSRRDGGSGRTHHLSHELVSQRQTIGPGTFRRQNEPAGETLDRTMKTTAHGGLRELMHHELGIRHQQFMQSRAAEYVFRDDASADTIGETRQLYD